MADWILNQFMNLFNSVLGWVKTSLGGLFGGLIEILLEALVDGFKATLSDIVHALLGGLVSEVTKGIEAVNWIPNWVKYGLTTFARNVGEALGTIADGAITMVAEGAAEILGVTNAQEIYMGELQTSLDVTMTALLERIEAGETTDIQIGEETAGIMIHRLNRNVNDTYNEATAFLQGTQVAISGAMQGARTFALQMLGTTLLNVQHIGRRALEMIDEDMAGVSTYITEFGIGEAERYLRTVENTIIIPAANADAMYWAFSEAMKVDEDDLATQLEAQFVAVLRLAAKMGKDPTALELHKQPFE